MQDITECRARLSGIFNITVTRFRAIAADPRAGITFGATPGGTLK